MLVDISDIRETKGASVRAEFSLAGEALDTPRDDVSFAGPVEVSVEVTNSGAGFLVSGEVKARLASSCSRCLEPAAVDIRVPILEDYVPESKSGSGDGQGGVNGQRDARTYTGDTLDLAEAVRDAIVMAAPIRFLCRDDCAGLCEYCGINRNESSCRCSPPGDPRFQVLAKLFGSGETDTKE